MRFYRSVLVLCMCASISYAGSFESAGLGARAVSMGGAFIGKADDWSSIYWNPAGLTQLKGSGIGSSIEYLRIRAHDSRGIGNPNNFPDLLTGDPFVQFGGEPSNFHGDDSIYDIPLPSIGFYSNWKGFSWAIGSYAPLGFSFTVSDDSVPGFPGYSASFKSQGYILNHNFSIAKELVPGVRVGGGLNIVQGHLERETRKITPSDNIHSVSKANALDVQGVLGLLVDLHPKVKLGAVYRTGDDLSFKGNASIRGNFISESSDYTQKLRNPATYGIGLSYQPIKSVTLGADWQRTEWQQTRLNIAFDNQGTVLQNAYLNPEWVARTRFRFGVEWKCSPTWTLTAGYFRDPRAVSNQSVALTQILDATVRYYTAGVSYQWRAYRFSLGTQYAYGSESVGTRTIKKEALANTLGVEYSFTP